MPTGQDFPPQKALASWMIREQVTSLSNFGLFSEMTKKSKILPDLCMYIVMYVLYSVRRHIIS